MGQIKSVVAASRAAYDSVGASYSATTQPFFEAVTYPIICELAQPIRSGTKVLDLGCGSGCLLELMQAHGAKCWGIDISSTMVALAQQKGLSVVEGSMHALPFFKDEFDVVIAHFSLQYLPPEAQGLVLEEAHRVLVPGGVFVGTLMHPYRAREGRTYFDPEYIKVMHILGKEFTLYLLDWPQIIELVRASGLELEAIHDAKVPANLQQLIASTPIPEARALIASFECRPYGLHVVARKKRC